MPVADFLWLLDNSNFDNPNALDAIKSEIQISPNLTKSGWTTLLNTISFIDPPIRTRQQFLDDVEYGKVGCEFLKDFINSVDLGISTLEAPLEQKTIIRNYIVNCDLGKLPEYMIRAEYTNEEGLIRSDMIEGLNVFDIVEASEETLSEFISNALNYTFNENDLILLDSTSQNMYFYTGGDKFSPTSYRQVNFGSVPVANVVGLQSLLEGKLDLDGRNLKTIEHYQMTLANIPVGTFAKNSNNIPHFYDGINWVKFGSNDKTIGIKNRIKKATFEGSVPEEWVLQSNPTTIEEYINSYEIKVKKGFKVLIPFDNIYKFTDSKYWFLTFKIRENSTIPLDNIRIFSASQNQQSNEIDTIFKNVTQEDDLVILKLRFEVDFAYTDMLGIEILETDLDESDFISFGYFQFNELQPSLFEYSSDAEGYNGVTPTITESVDTSYNINPQLRAEHWNLTMTGDTDFDFANMFDADNSKVITITLKGDYAFTFPSWLKSLETNDDYDTIEGALVAEIVINIKNGGANPSGYYTLQMVDYAS